ncbi:MAG: type II toxin-antitoxin system HicB family antitoxin [Candidatus Binatia bacterium]
MIRLGIEMEFLEFRILLNRDSETGQTVAEIPTLGISDYGKDLPEALTHLQEMLRFHLQCLQEEGKPIPQERHTQEGLYLRVKPPAHAA